MGKGTIGVVSAVLVWFSAATAAEAQNIDINGPSPTSILSGNSTYTPTVSVVQGPASIRHRLVIKRAGVIVYNSGWIDTEGTQLSVNVVNFNRTAGETLQHCWTATATGWTSETLTWNVGVTNGYYGFLSPEPGAVPDEALAWMSREDVGVTA